MNIGTKVWFYDETDNCLIQGTIKRIHEREYDREKYYEYEVEFIEEWYEEPGDRFSTVSQIHRSIKHTSYLLKEDLYLTKEYAYDKTIEKLEKGIRVLENKISYKKRKIREFKKK